MPFIRCMHISYSCFYGFNRKQLGLNRSKSLLLQFAFYEYTVRAVFLDYGRQIGGDL